MATASELVAAGFSPEAAKRILERRHASFKSLSATELDHWLNQAAKTYGVARAAIVHACVAYPEFTGLNHERVLRDIEQAYGADRERAAKLVMQVPRFASVNHAKARQKVEEGLKLTPENAAKLVLSCPALAGFDVKGRLASLRRALGVTLEQALKMVLTQPSLLGRNPERLKHRITRFADLLQVDFESLVKLLEKAPRLASLSSRRHVAAWEAARNAVQRLNDVRQARGEVPYVPSTGELLEIYAKYYPLTPYPIRGLRRGEDWIKRRIVQAGQEKRSTRARRARTAAFRKAMPSNRTARMLRFLHKKPSPFGRRVEGTLKRKLRLARAA
ncbi:MAG TPA: hypothetical protein HA252_01125 [Candidatus Diapherotrites archaeon]|uniref:Uncharacterized protein n=1 Tax=Candidatus Iainarchaeum sp. TaxID=3101447 RepID=A0A7J4JJ75_9ARCH|nr:hypothetical protein [Candidatus Diapherotrites archaeon]HIH15987.1 hypothetical protein [Candidatus Diapherotrites archaeon]